MALELLKLVLILVVLIGLVIVFKTQINKLFDGNLYGDQQTGERGILDEVPGRDYGFSQV